MRASHRNSGFSLVELMIVVLIVAILSAIAIPGYNNYVMRTNRGAAKACMGEYAQFMERYYTTSMTYVSAPLGSASPLGCASESGMSDKYTFTVSNVASRTYQINAVPKNAQATRDTKCTTMTLNQAGTRGAGDNTAATVATCW